MRNKKGIDMKNQEIIEDLLLKIAENDMNAFEQLYIETNKIVYSYTLAILKNHERAQDAMQDTFIRLKEAAYTYKPQGKPLAWILRIAKNFSLMSIRKGQKEQVIDIEQNEFLVNKGVELNVDESIVLNAALQTLHEEDREIVFLYLISGMKHREIAEILNKPLGTVLWKYNKALNKLKKELKHT